MYVGAKQTRGGREHCETSVQVAAEETYYRRD